MKLDSVIGFSKQITVFGDDPALPMSDTLMGVEVELERCFIIKAVVDRLTHWSPVSDGSLRNHGMEFIFQQPMYGTGIRNALNELQVVIDEINPTVSPRCSIHVHMNVSDLSVEQLYKLITLYTLVERPLMRYHGNDRENNIFCVPFYKAPHQLKNIADFNTTTSSRSVNEDIRSFDKYYALNIGAVSNHGSIEFRHMAGTTDMDKIFEWIQIIQHLKAFALGDNYDTNQNLLDNLSGDSGLLLRNIFGDELGSKLSYPGSGGDIIKGGRIVQEIMYNNTLIDSTDKAENKSKDSKVTKKIAALYRNSENEGAEEKKHFDLDCAPLTAADIARMTRDRVRRPAPPPPQPASPQQAEDIRADDWVDSVQWTTIDTAVDMPQYRYRFDSATNTVTSEEIE